ncbi:MAG: 3-methyl-2-oxobutanoate dehydrogenase subunit VorB [Bacillota bacterium]|nr:3-methyl-2-oxobutanoate dehydrogenase subunit VorB [Bacillota bacterium]
MSKKVLMKGNEAFAAAAIRGGARFYFGYPITPQNELTEYMARELNKVGGSFIQAESELAAISMVYGAAVSGGTAMLSSSSPGIALMQEGIGFLCSTEVPCVIINVSRGGPGIGSIQPSQADYFQATRGGSNGDYHVYSFAPASIQEAVDMIAGAFKIADEYRNPVLILADGMLGQMMEPVLLPEAVPAVTEEDIPKVKPWALAGHKDERKPNSVISLDLKPDRLEQRVLGYWGKHEKAKKELVKYQTVGLADAEVVLVSYGTTSRIVLEAIDLLAEEGIKAGLIRPISLWPYPYKAFDEIGPKTKAIVCAELSMGQMIEDVKLGAKERWPITLCNRVGGMLLSPAEVAESAKKALGVK